MFQIVTLAGVNPQFVLFTHTENSRSVQALTALGGEQNKANSSEELASLLGSKTGAVSIPIFDFTSRFVGVRRRCRFVRRSGKAHFPGWIPSDIEAGIRIYTRDAELSVEALRQFNRWRTLRARAIKADNRRSHETFGLHHGFCQ